VSAGYEMRVSDADREAATAELREHFASGRLDSDELDQRLTAAFAAKTGGDLNALFTDLPPGGGRQWAGADAPSGRSSSARPLGSGPFGTEPFGPGPFGPGSFGPGNFTAGPFGAGLFGAQAAERGGWDAPRAAGAGRGWRTSAGRGIGRLALASVLIWALFIFGLLGVFGIGTGRPLGVVLIFAAFTLLRRLVFIFLGRRRGRGPRPQGRGPRRRG
jgi:Domain of unknown function (DUF1707)